MHVSLLFLIVGLVNGVRQSSHEMQRMETESMPERISNALRVAQAHVREALKTAQTQEKEKDELKAAAEKTAEQKEAAEKASEEAAREASAKTQEAAEQAKNKAAAAATALSSNEDWKKAVDAHQKAQDKLQEANDDYNAYNEHVQAEIQKLNDKLAEKNQAKADAAAEEKETALKAEAGRIAYETAQNAEDDSVKALTAATKKVNEANNIAAGKATEAKVAGRDAEAAQAALDDAVAALNEAKEVVQHKKGMKKHLWALYDKVEDFCKTTSTLVRVMERVEDDCGDEPRHQCILKDEGGEALKKVLKGHNDMIVQYMVIKELYDEVWEDIKDTPGEVDKNAKGQVFLACDPAKELEDKGDVTTCYEGLWPAMDMNKAKIT